MGSLTAVLRTALVGVAVLAVAVLIAAHGVRGVLFLVALALLATLPKTRAWQMVERPLVRLTGSRTHALALLAFVLVGTAAAINLYELLR